MIVFGFVRSVKHFTLMNMLTLSLSNDKLYYITSPVCQTEKWSYFHIHVWLVIVVEWCKKCIFRDCDEIQSFHVIKKVYKR